MNRWRINQHTVDHTYDGGAAADAAYCARVYVKQLFNGEAALASHLTKHLNEIITIIYVVITIL